MPEAQTEPQEGRPICATTMSSLSRTHFECVPHPSECPGCSVVWEQGAGSRNSAVAPVWYRQSSSTNIPSPAPQEGVMGSRSRLCTGTWAPKASFSDLCRAAPSQSLSTRMSTIKWLCLHSQSSPDWADFGKDHQLFQKANCQNFFYLISTPSYTFGQYLMIIWYFSRSFDQGLRDQLAYSHNPMREVIVEAHCNVWKLWHGAITNLPQDYNQCMIEWEPSSDGWCSPSEESLSRFQGW